MGFSVNGRVTARSKLRIVLRSLPFSEAIHLSRSASRAGPHSLVGTDFCLKRCKSKYSHEIHQMKLKGFVHTKRKRKKIKEKKRQRKFSLSLGVNGPLKSKYTEKLRNLHVADVNPDIDFLPRFNIIEC